MATIEYKWPELPAAVAKERKRVLKLIEAHEDSLGMASARLWNLVNQGVDLDEEMKKPISQRIDFMHWPDEKRPRKKSAKRPKKRGPR